MKSKQVPVAGVLLAIVVLPGCGRLSEEVRDASAGMNGGFETVRSGLPVNWLVYTPSTVPGGDFELILDREDYKEGRQSLRFSVRECSDDGGWRSPGIAQEYPAQPGASYLVSFWIKSEGCDYEVGIGGVDAKTGEGETVDSSAEAAGSWRFVEHTYTMPERYDRIRFDLSIRSPGSLWIDDVSIEPIRDDRQPADAVVRG